MAENAPEQVAAARKLARSDADTHTVAAALGWYDPSPARLRQRLRRRYNIITNDGRKRAHNGDVTSYPELTTRLPGRLR